MGSGQIYTVTRRPRPWRVVLPLLLLAACATAPPAAGPPPPSPGQISVTLSADGARWELRLPPGATVRDALQAAGVAPGELDRVAPSETTPLSEGAEVKVTRVTEKLEVQESVLPFERRTVSDEGLASGQRLLIQSGVNGKQEVTFRIVYEDGVEVSRHPVASAITAYPTPEIVMIGSQASFAIIPIQGTLAYISGGNAWIMQGNSGARRPLTVQGKLDGRAFSLSPDGRWLLYTTVISDTATPAAGAAPDTNQLWAASTEGSKPAPVDLRVRNIVHFAAWSPAEAGSANHTFAYSTAEPRAASPGWQANNDLILKTLDAQGRAIKTIEVLPVSAGGLYGWWGAGFAWSPDGTAIAYARADSLGLVTLQNKVQTELLRFTPLQTFSDWAWVPAIAWAPGGLYLYTVEHEPPETSQLFNVAAIPGVLPVPPTPPASPARTPAPTPPAAPAPALQPLALVRQSGMFALPSPSPVGASRGDERPFLVAYLQAADPLNSVASRYRLWVMDRDGSNAR
ncbi:MAG: G5 domain-containing protein, partial [Chloroflexi bacterium]|nr:G5 domain-containing protein [Chloroflexota bacterium]